MPGILDNPSEEEKQLTTNEGPGSLERIRDKESGVAKECRLMPF
jgi:hypothetical protein